MRWVDKGSASFYVDTSGRIIGTVALLEDHKWAWSAWESYGGPPLARGRADDKAEAKGEVKRVLDDA